MRNITNVCLGALLMASTLTTTGCFVSRKETVREVPVAPSTTTTIERHSSVQTVPEADVVHRETTVERTY